MVKNIRLAALGGSPVRTQGWPIWPQVRKSTEKTLLDVLYSGRWAISTNYTGRTCCERKFAQAFANYTGAKYCTPVSSGTAALTLAMLALGIGYGDEVLVPGLTWVACASSVMSIGAIPILVDIDEKTLYMSLSEAKKAITPRCKAIMLVHIYCSIDHLDEFVKLSESTGIPIIEDCSHSHGARWANKHVGTFGKIGCFSMQQSKLLTSGEGGAIITNDQKIYNLIEQLRCDGRMFVTQPKKDQFELTEIGSIQGQNMCLSEFQAAVLLESLNVLEKQNNLRYQRACLLTELLSDNGIETVQLNPKVTSPTYYMYIIKLNLNEFNCNSCEPIARALSYELQAPVNYVYNPLDNNILYCPLKSSRLPKDLDVRTKYNPQNFNLPHANNIRKTCIALPHSMLLSEEQAMHDITTAFIKIKKCKHELSKVKLN